MLNSEETPKAEASRRNCSWFQFLIPLQEMSRESLRTYDASSALLHTVLRNPEDFSQCPGYCVFAPYRSSSKFP